MTTQAHGFFQPMLTAALLLPNGTRLPFHGNLDAAQVHDTGTHLGSLAFVESATVELTLGLLPTVTLVLGPPHHAAREILNSNLLVLGDKLLEVQMGYVSRADGGPVLTPVFRADLQVPDVQLGEDISITLTGKGRMVRMLTTLNGRTFDRMTRRHIIEEVVAGTNSASQRNLKIDFSFVDLFPSATSKRLLDQRVSLTQGNRTDWAFLRLLAVDCECQMVVGFETLRFIPRDPNRIARVPQKILRLFDYPDGRVGAGEYPLMSVSCPTNHLYLSGVPGVVMREIDSKDRKLKEVVLDESTKPLTRTTESKAGDTKGTTPATAGKPAKGKAAGHAVLPGQPTEDNQRKAQDLRDESAMAHAVNLEVTCLGIPDVLPTELVAVRGVGLRYDLHYEVLTVTHSFEDGDFTTSLKLIGNTFEHLLQKALEPPEGPANKQKPNVPPANTTVKQPKAPK